VVDQVYHVGYIKVSIHHLISSIGKANGLHNVHKKNLKEYLNTKVKWKKGLEKNKRRQLKQP
jgi:hypothetical protein